MRFSSLLAFLFVMLMAAPSFAQTKDVTPDVPSPLQALVDRGAQIRYLGREHDMDGWIAIYQGQEQYYYITQDKKAFVTGLMFGEDGQPITINQVKELQAEGGNVLDVLAEDKSSTEDKAGKSLSLMEEAATKTPAERMFSEIESSNWIRLGSDKAPVIYSFVDPQCPHCHKMMMDLRKDYIESGKLQVRIIPVGFQDGSLAQAAFLLAAPDAEARFWQHLDGDKNALLAKADISTQAIQKNMALMQSWKFNVTPLTAYRGKDGKIKIVRGVVKDIPALLADLPAPGVTLAPASGLQIPTLGGPQ